MKKLDLAGLIDMRNFDLWNALIKERSIDIVRVATTEYSVYSINNTSTIYVPSDKLCAASFTHELLHIYLKISEATPGSFLTILVLELPQLTKIFSQPLLDHIGNVLEHIKMLPLFIELGFYRGNFLSDYAIHKLPNESITMIKKHFKKKGLFCTTYNASAIDAFIGKYFAAKGCPNETFDYSEGLRQLQSIDPTLFFILDRFMNAWIQYDYLNQDSILGGYYDIVSKFVDELKVWVSTKRIT